MSFLIHAVKIISLTAAVGIAVLVLYYALQGQRVEYIHSLHQKYGPVVRLTPNEVSIVDLSAVKEIYRVSTPFYKTKWYWEITGRKTSMFSMQDPHAHRTRRSLLAQPMSENALRNLEPIVNANIQKTMDGMAKENHQTGTTDIFKWFTYMATDIIGELSFSESFRMLDQVKPNQYYHDLKSIEESLATWRTILGALRFQPFKDAVGLVTRIMEYSTQSLARYERHIQENPTNPKPTLFTKLFTKENDGVLTRADVIGEGRSYIIAGRDTIATTTTYLVYTLCHMPGIRAKLIAELATLSEDFTWDDLCALPYLNNVIIETLRLYPAVSGPLPRLDPATGATLAGYHIPSGNTVSTQAYTLHRDPKTRHDPNCFDPDRWLSPTPEMSHAFLAFGAGTRICIGMHLARDEMRYATAKFFRAFPNANVVESEEGMQQAAYFLMSPRAGRCLIDLGP